MIPGFGARHATRLAVAANRRFYDALWSASYFVPPQRFNTWPLLSALAASTPARLEIGPGLRPRLLIAGMSFVDISRPALSRKYGRRPENRRVTVRRSDSAAESVEFDSERAENFASTLDVDRV